MGQGKERSLLEGLLIMSIPPTKNDEVNCKVRVSDLLHNFLLVTELPVVVVVVVVVTAKVI